MIRKVIGWALVIISVFFLFVFIMAIVYGLDSTVQTELVTTSIQSSVIGFFVCAGLSILLLKRQRNCSAKTSWWYKTRRVLGYIFIIMFMFSIPGLHHFGIYEILPRVLILIIAYFLLKSYKRNNQVILTNEKAPDNRTNIQIEDSNIKEYKPTSEWSLKSERYFAQEEIDAVSQAIVVASKYGNSVEFTMKSTGKPCYIPLDKSSNIGIGEAVDMKQAKLLTLEKEGESDIVRVKVKVKV